ncbi:MAG: SDR family NAD(P)-dependent oxidoreductase, partial [Gemmatimonadaceae bacterium]
ERPVALVTGASAGIGKVFAQRLAASGHDLLLVARDGVRLQQVADDLSLQYGINAESMPADLARDEGMRAVAARISQMERLDILVNNAGFGTRGKLVTRPVAEQATMLELHVMAPMLLTRAALPAMLARKSGTIINVASVASFIHSAGNVNYCATKAYLRVFTEGLATELTGTGVHVQALCPGFTRTEFHERAAINMESTPAFLWLDATRVVDDSLAQAARGGPTVCIPGARYKLIVLLIRYLPKWIERAVRTPLMKSRV